MSTADVCLQIVKPATADRACELVARAGAVLVYGPLGVVEVADGAGATAEVLRACVARHSKQLAQQHEAAAAASSAAAPAHPLVVALAGGALAAFARRQLGAELPPSTGVDADPATGVVAAASVFCVSGSGGGRLLTSASGCAAVLAAV